MGLAVSIAAGAAASGAAPAGAAPSTADWTALAKLPDWSGVWTPDQSDQMRQMRSNPPPWTPDAARKVASLEAEERAGRPKGLFIDCLPEAMPGWMLVSHNAMEALFTPGRVTLLGESDGNRLRRIYTDGRVHSDDPDPSFHGESIGHWEGDALVVDTIAVTPETYIAISESVGLPNGGDMRIVERIRLAGPDLLADDLEITAPHVLTRPWKTTRLFHRLRGRGTDIVEGVCLQGFFKHGKNAEGDPAFVPRKVENGNVLPDT